MRQDAVKTSFIASTELAKKTHQDLKWHHTAHEYMTSPFAQKHEMQPIYNLALTCCRHDKAAEADAENLDRGGQPASGAQLS